MSRSRRVLPTLALRAVFEASVVFPWAAALSGRPVPFLAVLAATLLLGALGLVRSPVHRWGLPTVGLVLGLLATAAGGGLTGLPAVGIFLGWRMAEVSLEADDPYSVESAFTLGLWVFLLGAVAAVFTRAVSGEALGVDALSLVGFGFLALVLAKGQTLRSRSRVRGEGVAHAPFQRVGIAFLGVLLLLASSLAAAVSPRTAADILGRVAGWLADGLRFVLLGFGYLLSPVFSLLDLFHLHVRTAPPRKSGTPHPFGLHGHGHPPLPAWFHLSITAGLLLLALALLLIAGRLLNVTARRAEEEGVFTEEREHVKGMRRRAPAGGEVVAGWPYSPAEGTLREGVRRLLKDLRAEGRGPAASLTLREWAGTRGAAWARLLSAYEAQRYGGGEAPPDARELVEAAGEAEEGPPTASPGG